MKAWQYCLLALSVATAAGGVAAQTYPGKPVRFIVPFPAGGSADIMARILSQKLQDRWGQPVVIDNRGGAGGNIAAELTAAAAPDGYTMFQFNMANAIAVSLYRKLNYDPVRDFSPVSLLASSPFILVAQPALKIGTVNELIALAKAQPGKVTYASAGNGGASHLAGELLKTMAGVNLTHVPYKGLAPALNDLLGGQVQLLFAVPGSALPHMKAGRVRGLGVTSIKRTPLAPELPTVAESGVPGYEVTTWFGLVTPANTPRTVVDKLYTDVKHVLGMSDVRDWFLAGGYDLTSNTSEQFAQYIKAEIARWRPVVKFSGAQID